MDELQVKLEGIIKKNINTVIALVSANELLKEKHKNNELATDSINEASDLIEKIYLNKLEQDLSNLYDEVANEKN